MSASSSNVRFAFELQGQPDYFKLRSQSHFNHTQAGNNSQCRAPLPFWFQWVSFCQVPLENSRFGAQTDNFVDPRVCLGLTCPPCLNEFKSPHLTMRKPRPNSGTKPLTSLTVTGLVASLIVFNVLVAYIRENTMTLVGFEPWLFTLIFLPTALLGGWLGLKGVESKRRWVGWLACLAGCGGMAFLYCLDHFNILVEQERWAKRQPPNTTAPIAKLPPLTTEELSQFTPISEGVRRASSLTLFEGLPHQNWDYDQHQRELATKKTVVIHDFPFYERPLVLSTDEVAELRRLCAAAGSYSSYSGEKLCGGYHPDYCLTWKDDTATYDLMICFGCEEMKLYGPQNYLIADLNAPFNKLLKKHQDQRPDRK